ncbi:MAG TPA: helix-turn-helix domain-containing protein [Rhodanobacteraceae bacterium]|nr:helix-turn-helix domain-containing protein [Rhodanobacteraceae bacterium]
MENKDDASAVLGRLALLLGVHNDSQLAKAAGVNRQTLGSWRSRGSVSYELCIKIARERGASLDWLLTGEGPMLRGTEAPGLATQNRREEGLLALFRELPEAEQREIQQAAEEKKRLREVERKLEEVSAQLAGRKAAS